MGNTDLQIAKKRKKDEFYTSLEVIEEEMVYYREYFQGKIIFLNCDDPDWSNFWQYFSLNFDFFGLKKLISTHYVYEPEDGPAYKLELEQQNNSNEPKVIKTELKGDGDFRSDECIELLKEADIVITNPPFSLWREYVAQLIEYEKKFIIIGNTNAITYKEIFPYLKDNKMWIGRTNFNVGMYFYVPDDYEQYHKIENGRKMVRVSTSCWYTNLEHNKRNEQLVLTKFYEGNEDKYPYYDNYNAIEVGTYKDIPMDYDGVMGVPITFIDKYNPEQFEILGSDNYDGTPPTKKYGTKKRVEDGVVKKSNTGTLGPTIRYDEFGKGTFFDVGYPVKSTYKRIFIRNKQPISKKEMLGY